MRKISTLIIFSLFLFVTFITKVSASDVCSDPGKITECDQLISDLTQKIAKAQDSARTLAGQIAYYDNQISLATLKIQQTESQINSISGKIVQLENQLQSKVLLLQRQIAHTYKQGSGDPIRMILSSKNFSQMLQQLKYAQLIQSDNRRFLHDAQLVQSNFAKQKLLVETSKKNLQIQKTNLAAARESKDNLLKQTKNDEATYQKQLEQARLEQQAIKSALALGKKEGPVKAGDPIAMMGNSGYPSCSTGTHLHFEVRVNDAWVSAGSYLKNQTDKWGLNIGSGNWDWPVKGNLEITQRYGKTPYSYVYVYSGGVHTGIDIYSDQKVIYAVADGTLYSYTGKCGSSSLNIKYIDHGNGLKTLYLHVQ